MRRGQAIVEFALIAVLLFGILFSIIDWGLFFYQSTLLNASLNDSTREAITWDWEDESHSTLQDSLKNKIIARAHEYGLTLSGTYLSVNCNGEPLCISTSISGLPYTAILRTFSRVPNTFEVRTIMTVIRP